MNTYELRGVCKNCKRAKALLFRVDASRLEESLGHHIYQCEKCGVKVKVVPTEDITHTRKQQYETEENES